MSMFINRKEELNKLSGIYRSKRAELVLVYGRRRIGKSRLLLESIKNKNAIYFLADMSKNILEILAKQTNEEFVKFSTWDDFFEYVYKSKYEIFVIDEFQYLYDIDKAWPTILQRWWEKIKETNKKIILCGSIISTIYKIARGYGSALYGRKTYELEVMQLKFKDISKFFRYSNEDLVKVYSILGGIPRYLEEFDKKSSINDNIKNKLIDKTSFLYNEPVNLLYEEFRDATPYISIILAITNGKVRFNEISNASRIDGNKLPKYLSTLERVGIIEREIPVTEKKIKGKTTRYKVKDNFYKFWFKFVFSNKSQIEQGLSIKLLAQINENLNMYISFVFEEICEDFLIDSKKFNFTRYGKWWHKDKEIDIVALNEQKKEILFAECKWQDKINVNKVIKELSEKSKFVDWNNKERKESFAVFAKSFSKRIKELDGKKVYCFDLKDIEKSIKRKS